jgi:hypothetical protein
MEELRRSGAYTSSVSVLEGFLRGYTDQIEALKSHKEKIIQISSDSYDKKEQDEP